MFSYRLTNQSYNELREFLSLESKLLGKILQEADLISPFQLETALAHQAQDPELRLGDILAQRGIVEPRTADFFVQDWSKIVMQPEKDTLGFYLQQAAILSSAQIKVILAEQQTTGVRFGTVAVFQGFLKSTTLDFFLANLFPDQMHRSPFINMNMCSAPFVQDESRLSIKFSPIN